VQQRERTLLLDASEPTLGSIYGESVMRLVLRTGALQRRRAHVRVSIGNILTCMLTPILVSNDDPLQGVLPNRPTGYGANRWSGAVSGSTVFCWLLQNLAEDAADEADAAFAVTPGYLGP
jgi:hypothetical protein